MILSVFLMTFLIFPKTDFSGFKPISCCLFLFLWYNVHIIDYFIFSEHRFVQL